MSARVNIDRGAVHRIVDEAGSKGMQAAGEFLKGQQQQATRSSRLAGAVRFRVGRDRRGWYVRSGMLGVSSGHPAFFWYFEEFQTGRGGGQPFIRPALDNNRREVARRITGGR